MSPAIIIEDHDATRLRLARILVTLGVEQAHIRYACDVASARLALAQAPCALALVDVGLPDGSGIDLIRWLHARTPDTLAVVISTFGTQDQIIRALQGGAVGYLLKEREDFEIAAALRSIRHGGAPIDPFVARHILRLVGTAPVRPAIVPPGDDAGQGMTDPLTRREEEILTLVAQGLVTREIAERLSRSPLTVDAHVKNILRKLQVSTRTKAINQARAMGLL